MTYQETFTYALHTRNNNKENVASGPERKHSILLIHFKMFIDIPIS